MTPVTPGAKLMMSSPGAALAAAMAALSEPTPWSSVVVTVKMAARAPPGNTISPNAVERKANARLHFFGRRIPERSNDFLPPSTDSLGEPILAGCARQYLPRRLPRTRVGKPQARAGILPRRFLLRRILSPRASSKFSYASSPTSFVDWFPTFHREMTEHQGG